MKSIKMFYIYNIVHRNTATLYILNPDQQAHFLKIKQLSCEETQRLTKNKFKMMKKNVICLYSCKMSVMIVKYKYI